jgi:hypothetical protein
MKLSELRYGKQKGQFITALHAKPMKIDWLNHH